MQACPVMLRFAIVLALLGGACPRSGRPLPDAGVPMPPRPARRPTAEVAARRAVFASVLRIEAGLGGSGTAFGCLRPGLACTAKHVVGSSKSADVVDPSGRKLQAKVLARHPHDDVALLDVRGLEIPPLAVTPLDSPPEGTVVCRLGYPPSLRTKAFLRCDPIAGILLESTSRNDGAVVPRLIHLGVGFKGDSGAPLYDPQSGLVVGIHVSEANGSARAATATAIQDLLRIAAGKHKWLRKGCSRRAATASARTALSLLCPGNSPARRAERYRRLGAAMLGWGRRAEALAAFEEALEIQKLDARNWLWRALVFPRSSHARDDAAFAFRLDPGLRYDEALGRVVSGPRLDAARRLRDEVAPLGVRLATLVGEGGCASCPAFCAAARAASDVRLWVVEGANHPLALRFVRELARRDGGSERSPLLAIDGKAVSGCGKLKP